MRVFLKLSAMSLMSFYCSLLISCCSNGVKQTHNGNDENNFYVMKELKDFDLNYFVSDDFQMLNGEMKNFRDHLSLFPPIQKKIENIVFEKITGIKELVSDE